ncbi:GL16162 [Drosophila persimilis]|uniref:GL16162 n=1 Tax=Drosophila persimilis TaxID=7234 RepID=B4GQJ4_DROPE|nr:GL16162 [Drosophila persimilis]
MSKKQNISGHLNQEDVNKVNSIGSFFPAVPKLDNLRRSEENFRQNQYKAELCDVLNTYGTGMALTMQMDRTIANRVGHPSHMSPSYLMDDILTGRIHTFGFEDYLNLPHHNEQIRNPHFEMENSHK